MEIKSVSYKNGTVRIKYSKGGEIFSLESEERPHPDFVKAINGLADILKRFLGVNPEKFDRNFCKESCEFVHFMQNRISAKGLSVNTRETDDAPKVTYKILGSIAIPPTGKDVDFESLSLTYDVDWFEMERRDGTKIHTPNGSPTYLTNADIEVIRKVVEAAGDFVSGVREQGTLPFGAEDKEKAEEKEEQDLFAEKTGSPVYPEDFDEEEVEVIEF